MKKLLGMLLIIIVALFGFAACVNGNANGSDGNIADTGGNDSIVDTGGNSGSGNDDVKDENDSTIPPADPSDNDTDKEITKMYITIDGNKLEVTLAENSSVDALVEILKHGDITYTANDYGNFEKVGDIGHTLPQNNTQITTQAGDVILYQGRNICLYYDTNNWSFTRIGKINGYSASELRTLLGAGNGSVQVTIGLN